MTSTISKQMRKLFSAQSLGLVTCFALMLTGPKPANATTALDFTGTSQNGFQAALTFGWSFSVTETIGADGLGFFDDFLVDGRGLQQDHRVRLWTDEATPVLLAETIITNASTPVASTASDGQWLFNDIGLVLLTPGRYVLGADDPQCGGADCDRIRFQDSAATIPQITFLENRDASPIGFPASSASGRNDGYFGPTFRVTVVPEPATLGLMLFAAAIAVCQRRP